MTLQVLGKQFFNCCLLGQLFPNLGKEFSSSFQVFLACTIFAAFLDVFEYKVGITLSVQPRTYVFQDYAVLDLIEYCLLSCTLSWEVWSIRAWNDSGRGPVYHSQTKMKEPGTSGIPFKGFPEPCRPATQAGTRQMEILQDKLLEKVHGGEIPTKIGITQQSTASFGRKTKFHQALGLQRSHSTLADNLGSQDP